MTESTTPAYFSTTFGKCTCQAPAREENLELGVCVCRGGWGLLWRKRFLWGKGGKRGGRKGTFVASFQGLLSWRSSPYLFFCRANFHGCSHLYVLDLSSPWGQESWRSLPSLHPEPSHSCLVLAYYPSLGLSFVRDLLDISKFPSCECTVYQRIVRVTSLLFVFIFYF